MRTKYFEIFKSKRCISLQYLPQHGEQQLFRHTLVQARPRCQTRSPCRYHTLSLGPGTIPCSPKLLVLASATILTCHHAVSVTPCTFIYIGSIGIPRTRPKDRAYVYERSV